MPESDATPTPAPEPKPYEALVIVSDEHLGSLVGLSHPDGEEMDNGARSTPGPLQLATWGIWDYVWKTWVPSVLRGRKCAVIQNGDALDGNHHGAVDSWTLNGEYQRRAFERVMREVLAQPYVDDYFHLRGTEAHGGKSGQDEESVARALGARPNEANQYARDELRVWVRPKSDPNRKSLADIQHHISGGGVSAYETTAVHRELIEAFTEANKQGEAGVDFLVRAHRHRFCQTGIHTERGICAALVQPGFQGKMLALDTPLPTPTGWTTMGDVGVGDLLFDEKGDACRVIRALPVDLKPKSYLVRFSNGDSVKACADHLWLTTAYVDKPNVAGTGVRRPLTRVRTTEEIAATLRFGRDNETNHVMPMPDPIHTEGSKLPVDPYVLGCWLGDGDSDCARLTALASDAECYKAEFARSGYRLDMDATQHGKTPRWHIRAVNEGGEPASKQSPDNLQSILRNRGLLGHKHIPAEYLRASIADRIALLQGLMDTDGYAENLGRVCEFVTTRTEIRDGMNELLATLGIKFTCVERMSMLSRREFSPMWRIRFFASPDFIPVFRLKRKLNRIPLASSRKIAQRSRSVSIVSAEPCDPVPMRCIAVDSPSHLYRFGKTMLPTHNTPFAYRIMGGRMAMPQFGVVAIIAGDEETYWRAFVKGVARPRIEG